MSCDLFHTYLGACNCHLTPGCEEMGEGKENENQYKNISSKEDDILCHRWKNIEHKANQWHMPIDISYDVIQAAYE